MSGPGQDKTNLVFKKWIIEFVIYTHVHIQTPCRFNVNI